MTTTSHTRGCAPRRASLVAIALVLAVLGLQAPAGATRLQSARARLAALKAEIERQVSAIEAQHRRLSTLASTLARVETAQRETMTELLTTQHRLSDTQTRYTALRTQLGTVARTAYEQGPFAGLDAVLGATSFADLSDRLEYLDNVQMVDATVADGVATQAAKLRISRHDLSALSSRQAAQTLRMHAEQAALLSALLAQQRQLADLSQARRKAERLVRILSLPPDPGITGAGTTFGHWATLLLTRLGSPTCQDNLTVIVTWEVAEGTAAAFNPLATTHNFPAATDFNSVGVKNYPTLQAGLQATIETLRLGSADHGYGAILDDLAGCASAKTTAEAINDSDWCRGCAGGMYVLDMLPLVEADYPRFGGE